MSKAFVILFLFHVSTSFGQAVFCLSTALHNYPQVRDFCLSADEEEAYFTIQSPNQDLSQLVVVHHKKWDNPILLPFCDGYSYLEPFLSSDGKRLYFASDRPKHETDTLKSDFDIWYVERKNNSSNWSKPINLGIPVNSENNEFYPTLSDNGNLYFTMESATGMGKDDIYYCPWNGLNYAEPQLLNCAINSEGYEFNAFISKDERYIIFTKYNAKDGLGSGDLYISKKDSNGAWQVAENMGNLINSPYMEYCPFYHPQTQTLYFTSKRAKLTPQKFNDLQHYMETLSGCENGASKLYYCILKI